jgi:hypothetical protein
MMRMMTVRPGKGTLAASQRIGDVL